MICKKCETATPEEEKECVHCGFNNEEAKVKRNRFFAGILAITFIGLVVLVVVDRNRDFDETPEEDAFVNEDRVSVDELILKEEEEDKAEAEYIQPIERTWDRLKLWQDILKEYVAKTDPSTLVPMAGYIYNLEKETFIQPKSLKDEHMIKELENSDETVHFLYVNANDLALYDEVKIEGKDENIFIVAQEVTDGVALYGDRVKSIIYRENYEKLLQLYKTETSPIVRPLQEQKNYQDIEEALQFFSPDDTFDIRYIANDNRFAFAVIHIKGEDSLRYSLLERKDNTWSVHLYNIEQESMIKDVLMYNQQVDIEILPNQPWIDELATKEKKAELVETLLDKRLVPEKELPFPYFSVGKRYFYAETKTGKLYLGIRSGDIWDIRTVADFREAEKILELEEIEETKLHIQQK